MVKSRSVTILISFLNVLGVLAVITVNALAVLLPINGKSTKYLSDSLPNLFVPAGMTFSIWGIIYILLIGYGVFQLAASLKKDQPAFLCSIGGLFALSCLLNCAWIFAWHYQLVFLSLVIMLALFGTLLAVYLRLHAPEADFSSAENIFIRLPMSVYLGWITVAVVANVTAWLVSINWNGFGISPVIWTVAVIAAVVFVAIAVIMTQKDAAYSLVVIWALLGIAVKRFGNPQDFNAAMSEPVGTAAVAAIALILIVLVPQLVMQQKKR